MHGKAKRASRAVAIASMSCILCVAGVLSFLTASDAKENRFSIAEDLQVEVVEASWDALPDVDDDGIPDAAEGMIPGQSVTKDPAIVNKGSTGAYAFMQVDIPMKNVVTANADGTRNPQSPTELFAFEPKAGWNLVSHEQEEGKATYLYAYERSISSESTPTLFDSIRLANLVDGQVAPEDALQQVVVTAHAIQSEGFEDPNAAWQAYLGKENGATNAGNPSTGEPAQEEDKVAFCVYSDDDCSLNFYNRPYEPPTAGESQGGGSGGSGMSQFYSLGSAETSPEDMLPARLSTFDGRTVAAAYVVSEDEPYSSTNLPAWHTDYMKQNVMRVKIKDPISPASMSYWFANMSMLVNADLALLDTSHTTGMESVFAYDTELRLDCSGWDVSAVTEHADFNFGAPNVISPFKTEAFGVYSEDDWAVYIYNNEDDPKVGETYMGRTVTGVTRRLESRYATPYSPNHTGAPWDKSQLKSLVVVDRIVPVSLTNWFNNAALLESVDIEKLDTSKLSQGGGIFDGCNNLTELDLSGWDVSRITSFANMFRNCKKLTTVGDLSGWDVSKVTSMHHMFENCLCLESLDLHGWDVSNVTNMQNIFFSCMKLQTLDIEGWQATRLESLRGVADTYGGPFYYCKMLEEIDVSGWDVSRVSNFNEAFSNCTALRRIVGIEDWDTSSATLMLKMFISCDSLTSLDLSRWDVSKVQSMQQMFAMSTHLESVNMSGWDTRACTNPINMFNVCYALKQVTIGANYTLQANLPVQESSHVPGADGKWYSTSTRQGYAPADVPAGVAATYVASPNLL